ncbi:MAG TPA: non-ribosomal peptide synthetase, partial [Thermoanaerobaculia bacterium]|nr:non-ribosomal peptide synthetase [Thermoanaerobaculia bacterium]
QTPSAFRQLIAYDAGAAPLPGLRLVILGGEALDPRMLEPWFERYGDAPTRVVNMYGITETTVHATYRRMDRTDLLRPGVSPIGRAIPDLQVWILDTDLRPCPTGVTGEIHVAGPGLARGYLGRPDLTRERFVPNPFGTHPGERLYRSGDLGRLLPDGEIEYLGRADDQIKIRGHRIEPGEIESALRDHPAVRDAAVAAREDAPGDRRLVAYVVGSGDSLPSGPELRAYLKRRLPDAMVPAAIVALEAMPLTANGKLDRRGLPPPDEKNLLHENGTIPPRRPVEAALAEIWSRALGTAEIGIGDDFFALGGDSLRATRVVSRIRDAFGVELPLRAIFD